MAVLDEITFLARSDASLAFPREVLDDNEAKGPGRTLAGLVAIWCYTLCSASDTIILTR